MDSTKVFKNRIAQRLATTLINADEKQLLDRHEISILASYIREEFLNKQHTDSEILRFVEELAQEVPIFAGILADPAEHPVKTVNRRWLEQIASK